jgi:hypothetical protein
MRALFLRDSQTAQEGEEGTMKFFTPELHVRMQDCTSDAAMNAADAASETAAANYDRHLREIEPEMPECYHKFDGLLLHGAQVWTAAWSDDRFFLVLRKDIPPQDVVILTYTLTRAPYIKRDAFPPLYRSNVMSVLCDEFDLERDGDERIIVQSILFANGWEIRLHFRSVEVTLAEPLYPPAGTMLIPASTAMTPPNV